MKVFVILFTLLALAGLTPAPVFSQYAPGYAPEHTQEQRSAEQSLQRVQGVLGTAPSHMDSTVVPLSGTENEGASTLQNSNNHIVASTESGSTVLRQAEADVDSNARSPLRSLILLLLAGSFGYGCFFGFRKWADKNLPDPKFTNRSRW